MSLRFHEISELNHRILNPLSEQQLMLLGELCRLQPGQRQLDLCCGKGEMLSRWAAGFGLIGTGVDISPIFLAAARQRAVELAVADRLTFVEADAARYPVAPEAFDLVSCIGATWIGQGLHGTLEIMRPGLASRDSLLLVGEPFWMDDPPAEACAAIAGSDRELFATLPGTLDRFEAAGLELIEMVLADNYGWERYSAAQWWTVSDWLRQHPDSPEAAEIRREYEQSRREYLTYGRRYLGWGVFVLRQP